MASICSKHQVEDPNCSLCKTKIDFGNVDFGLVTCKSCNFTYYDTTDICPKCQKENL